MKAIKSQNETELIFNYLENVDFVCLVKSFLDVETKNKKLWIAFSVLENNKVVYEIYNNTELLYFDYSQEINDYDEDLLDVPMGWIEMNIGCINESEFVDEVDLFFKSINVRPIFLGDYSYDKSFDVFKKIDKIFSVSFFTSDDYYEILRLLDSFENMQNQYQLTLYNLIKFDNYNSSITYNLLETIDSFKLKLFILRVSINNGNKAKSKLETLDNLINSKCINKVC